MLKTAGLGLRSIQKNTSIKTIFLLFNQCFIKSQSLTYFQLEHFQHLNFGQNKVRCPDCCAGPNHCAQFKLEIAS